jgi:hypothetical protein
MASRGRAHGPGTDRRADAAHPGRPDKGKEHSGRTIHAEPAPGRPDATVGRDPARAATPGREEPPENTEGR